eukprot:jgi/Bigna1/73483/fgenesh1_pg.24_\
MPLIGGGERAIIAVEAVGVGAGAKGLFTGCLMGSKSKTASTAVVLVVLTTVSLCFHRWRESVDRDHSLRINEEQVLKEFEVRDDGKKKKGKRGGRGHIFGEILPNRQTRNEIREEMRQQKQKIEEQAKRLMSRNQKRPERNSLLRNDALLNPARNRFSPNKGEYPDFHDGGGGGGTSDPTFRFRSNRQSHHSGEKITTKTSTATAYKDFAFKPRPPSLPSLKFPGSSSSYQSKEATTTFDDFHWVIEDETHRLRVKKLTRQRTVVGNVSYSFGRHIWAIRWTKHSNGNPRIGVALPGFVDTVSLGSDGCGFAVSMDLMGLDFIIIPHDPLDDLNDRYTQHMSLHQDQDAASIDANENCDVVLGLGKDHPKYGAAAGRGLLIFLDCERQTISFVSENVTTVHTFHEIGDHSMNGGIHPAYSTDPQTEDFELGRQKHFQETTKYFDALERFQSEKEGREERDGGSSYTEETQASSIWREWMAEFFPPSPHAEDRGNEERCCNATSKRGYQQIVDRWPPSGAAIDELCSIVGGDQAELIAALDPNITGILFWEELQKLETLRSMRYARFGTRAPSLPLPPSPEQNGMGEGRGDGEGLHPEAGQSCEQQDHPVNPRSTWNSYILTEAPRKWLLPRETKEDLEWAYRLEFHKQKEEEERRDKEREGGSIEELATRNTKTGVGKIDWKRETWEGVGVHPIRWPPSLWEFVEVLEELIARCEFDEADHAAMLRGEQRLIRVGGSKAVTECDDLAIHQGRPTVFGELRKHKGYLDLEKETRSRLLENAMKTGKNSMLGKTSRLLFGKELEDLTKEQRLSTQEQIRNNILLDEAKRQAGYSIPTGTVMELTDGSVEFAGFTSAGVLQPPMNMSKRTYTEEDHRRDLKKKRIQRLVKLEIDDDDDE